MKRSPLGAMALSLTLFAAACGSDGATEATEDVDPTTDDATMDDGAMDGMSMDGMAMNMGDASATRADDVEGAALATGEFELLDTRPQGFDDMTGTAWIARHPGGTTVTLEVSGLIPDADYISHVHADVCANSGGDHYQFEVGGSEMPPNEIHLAFTSDADGNGFMTAENHQIAGLDAVAFVVHPADLIDNKLACVDFVELEPGAAAAAIEQGVDPALADSHMDDMGDMGDMEMDDMDHGGDDGAMDMDDAMEDVDHGGESALPAGFDVEALHAVDDDLNAGIFDAESQGEVVDTAMALVGDEPELAELKTALTDLAVAIEAGDAESAAALATIAHDVAHAMEGHEN